MKEIELFVKLLIPDNIAITTFHTLQRMGYSKLKKIERYDYYKFFIGNEYESDFVEKIKKTDILVNANKHNASDKINRSKNEKINIIVQSIDDDCKGLLSTLKERLGFNEINKMEKGVLWSLYIDSEDYKKTAKEIADKLLHNENYQKIKIV